VNSVVSLLSDCAVPAGSTQLTTPTSLGTVSTFTETYNNEWLIERLGHRIPREAFIEATAQVTAR
jgi:hypothetical protein